MIKKSMMFGAVFGLLAFATQTYAVVLNVNTSVDLFGTTAAARPELAGTVILDEVNSFTGVDALGNTLYTGDLQVRIVRETVSGTLDFYYRIISNDASSLDAIMRTTHTNFAGWTTDVDYRIDGLAIGGVGPASANRNVSGSTVGFNFDGGLQPGDESLFYFIKTTATNYTLGSTVLIDGGIASVQSYAPTIVPVPAAAWLLGSGLLGLVGVARRKKS